MIATVIGDGGWGTALALTLVRNGHAPRVWGPDAAYSAEVRATRRNPRFMPGVELPEGMRMVGKAVNITKNRSGLGSMQISVQQQGNTLDITRKLVLEKSTVSDSKDYKALREWLQLWSHHKEIIIK